MKLNERVVRLGAHPAEVPRARRQVDDFCGPMTQDLRGVAQLLTSELVTNALRHGAGEVMLHLSATAEQLRVEVHNTSPIPAQPSRLGQAGVDRPGRVLVEALASRWGTSPNADGQGHVVWFTLRAPRDQGPAFCPHNGGR